MKSLSCISLRQPQTMSLSPPPSHKHHDSLDSLDDGPEIDVLGPKSSRMHTMIEVFKCEFARPGRPAVPVGQDGIEPSKTWTPVHYAAYHAREAALLHFLRAGQSPDGLPGSTDSPLLVAVAAGHIGIVKILCAAGANANSVTEKRGETALHLAIKSGRIDIMDVLLSSHGNSIELDAETPQDRETPLHYAAAKPGSLPAVVALLKFGANYEALNAKGCTAAETAISNSNINAAVAIVTAARGDRKKLAKEKEMLLRHVEKKQSRLSMNNELIADVFEAGRDPGSTVLIEAIQRDDYALAEMFLEKGADPSRPTAKGLHPIFAALECSGARMVQLLVKHEADATILDAQGRTAIQAAFESPSVKDGEALLGIFEALLTAGADPNVTYEDGKTLLHHAVSSPIHHPKIAQRLLESGVDVNQVDNSDSSALHYAIHTRPCLEVLLKNRADPNLLNNDGLTPLLKALSTASRKAEPDLELLVKASDLRVVDKDQRTALHIAAHRGLARTIRLLLKHRADTTLVNLNGQTSLMSALCTATSHAEPDLEPLIKVSDLRSVDNDQRSALHIAAERGLARTVHLLLKHRAETTLVDSNSRTPLLLAVLEHRWRVVPLLATQPGINSWDEDGTTALHHMVTSIPKAPSTWNDIASTTAKFCERGVSRTMRNRKGATPLIAAVVTLPEDGLPVIEALLAEKGPARGNCIGHEDHKQRSALYYAATLEKPVFVRALLKNGAPFALKDWTLAKGPIQPSTPAHKQTLKLIAEHEWMRRIRTLRRRSGSASPVSTLPVAFPLEDLEELLSLGLDPNALPAGPKANIRVSLLWTVLNQSLTQPPFPEEYLHDVLKLLVQFKADTNAITSIKSSIAIPLEAQAAQQQPTRHPLTFLLEEHPTLPIDVLTLFITSKTTLSTPSPAYANRHPLHSAVAANRFDIASLLLSTHRTDPNPLDDKKATPLFIAATHTSSDIADLLLKSGAQASLTDVDGNTPLHIAAATGSVGIISTLLRAGAKATLQNNAGSIASQCVKEDLEDEREKSRILRILKGAQEQEGRDEERRLRMLEAEKKAKVERERRRERERERELERERERERQREIQLQEKQERERKDREVQEQKRKERESALRSSFVPLPIAKKSDKNESARTGKGRYFSLSARSNSKRNTLSPAPAVHRSSSMRLPPLELGVQRSASTVSPNSTFVTNISEEETNLTVKDKPLPQQPRIDSGFGYARGNGKEAPVLDRGQKTLDAPDHGDKEREEREKPSDELEGWLAFSKMLDRL